MMLATVSVKITTRYEEDGAFANIFPFENPEPPVGLMCFEGLRRMELVWNGVRGVELRAYRGANDLCAPALHIRADWEDVDVILEQCFYMDWPFDASQVETLVVCGDLRTLRANGRNPRVEGRR
ncbi:hypothetical protein GY45DRAFT_1326756 [Cubamyces sp. BRFM 1775]|nr:hypothetical protein GY45DRAFT_1326756 [Cubamyces sp. BRFM 1775]